MSGQRLIVEFLPGSAGWARLLSIEQALAEHHVPPGAHLVQLLLPAGPGPAGQWPQLAYAPHELTRATSALITW
jgi:hypothetical protein